MNSKITYRQQYTRCGKQRCRKCREGAGHGPYWYAYWSEKGRTVSKYIGTHLPEHIEASRHLIEDEKKEHSPGDEFAGTQDPLLRIYLLGQFRIERKIDGEWKTVDSRTWHRRRARALLGCLLSNSGRRLGREQVMELLWPDLDIDVAANRLNGAVHELRQILEPDIARPAASRLLRLERDILELANSTQIWVDAEAFENLIKEAYASPDPKQTELLLEEAALLYRGSYLLEELYSEWATPRRDALQRAWIGLLLHLANLRAEQHAFVSAIEILDRLRTAEPSNETALQRLMILLTHLDRRGEALQIYRHHVTMLRRDYENEPLPETSDLYESLCQGHIPTMYMAKTQPSPPKEKEVSTPITQPLQKTPPLQEVSFTRPAFQLGRHNQSPLIGRNRELEAMRQAMLSIEGIVVKTTSSALEEETQGAIRRVLHTTSSPSGPRRPHFLLLKGESGIGKTRLAEELSLDAYTRGWAIAWSRSYEQEGTIPYHPWIELLRTLLQEGSTFEDLLSMTIPTASISPHPSSFKLERISALLPELATQTLPTRSASPVLHEQERLHLWEATLGLLGALSKTHPLLLVLDDLHWADDSSIELLAYLTHHIQDQRILLVGTCRDGEIAPQHKLHTLIADLRREQAIIALQVQPLSHSQIGTLVSHLPEKVVQKIQTQAAGNPFFAEELARYVGATQSIEDAFASITLDEHINGSTRTHTLHIPHKIEHDTARTNRPLPEAIAGVLERRLSRLSRDCQILLGKAVVLGGSFELNQLLPMANEHSEDTILDLLEEALHAGLLTEEGTGVHITYHFWHPLIINHLYERISAARRAQLHRRAAEAIKMANPSTQQEKAAAAIVYHLSRGGGDASQVAYYAQLAGNQAYTLAAYSEAQQYYLQVIQAIVGHALNTPQDADLHTHIQRITLDALSQVPLADPLHICRLLERVAECSVIQGDFEDARHLYECALALRTSENFKQQTLLSTSGDREKLKQEAQIQGLLWREIGNTWRLTGDYAKAYQCYGQGKDVMSQAGITTGAAWAGLHLQYGDMLRLEGHYSQARRCLQEALETLECVVQQQSNDVTTLSGQKSESTCIASLPEKTSLPFPKELQTRTERTLIGDPLEIGYAHERLGIVDASLSQLSDALSHMQTALTIYELGDLVSEMARVCGNLGAVYILRGELELASQYMHRSLKLAERVGDIPNMAFVMLNLGDVTHRTGDLQESEEWFKRSLTIAERINDRERISWCNVDLAAVQQDLGNLRESVTSIQRALSIGRAIQSPRCTHYALIRLGDLRITQAIIAGQLQFTKSDENKPSSTQYKRLLSRAKSTLQRAISLDTLEVENIIEGKHLLATIYFLLGDLEIAHHMALQILKEAQEYEGIRIVGRVYRLLGCILAEQRKDEQADRYFEQAIQIFNECGLRLDYARTLHGYGAALLKRYSISDKARVNRIQTGLLEDQIYQKGLGYLQEAHAIFTDNLATIDRTWVEYILAQFDIQK